MNHEKPIKKAPDVPIGTRALSLAGLLAILLFISLLTSALAATLQSESGLATDNNIKYSAESTSLYFNLDTIDVESTQTTSNEIFTGTRVALLGQQESWSQVRIEGWQQDGLDSVIYAFEGKRIRMVHLDDKDIVQIERLESVTDPDTDLVWHHVNVIGWVFSAVLIDEIAPLWERGNELLLTSCSKCHAPHLPNEYTANQWPSNLEAMLRFTNLTEQQYDLLLSYLQYNAKDLQTSE